jgi:hypothetical protein
VEKFGISPVDEVQLSVEFPIAMPSGKSFLNLARPEVYYYIFTVVFFGKQSFHRLTAIFFIKLLI